MISHTPSARYSPKLIVTLLSFALFLSACGGIIETDLTLYAGDRFEATSRITVPIQGLMSVGGAEAIESELEEMAQQAKAAGVKCSWRKENSKNADEVVYSFTFDGTGYESLADTYEIYVQKTQYKGKDALAITAGPNYDLSDIQNTVRLHVGKILETDNQRSGNNTIIWTGTEALYAIVTPASSTDWLTILPIVLAVVAVATLAVVVVAVLALVFLRRRPAGQVVTAAPPSAAVQTGGFCPHCGHPAQPGAKFCMSCGQTIPPRSS